ncbi:MAG TPA: hypothetical protein ENH28_04710, partial [Euryarchaeota archaeon]|nr:hypothetical protein [Euryarchaeota archaeon]
MAANKKGKVYTMGVGGYQLPDGVITTPQPATQPTHRTPTPLPKPRKAVLPFWEGKNGRAISRAKDGILVLLERNCFPVPLSGEVWRGILRVHHSGGFYVFSPEEILKINPFLREVPPFVALKDLGEPIVYLVRLQFADGKERVIAVKPAGNLQDIIQVEQLQKVAHRFGLSQKSLSYNEVERRLKNLKHLYDLRYNEEALENLFIGLSTEETTTPTLTPAHSHNTRRAPWMLRQIFRVNKGKLVISTQ